MDFNIGSVQVLRHRVSADADDALREEWGVQNQYDDVILEYVSHKYVFM